MQELILTRGIPACGKSTWANAWVKAGENRVRVNRDEIRMQMFGVWFGCDERLVTKMEDALVATALKAGQSVVVDDTNIRHEFVKRLANLGHAAGARVSIRQFDIDLDEALRRNALRDRKVPEDVIREMHRKLQASGAVDITPTVEPKPYVPVPGTPMAIMFDIDGTLAEMKDRSPYEWHRVGEDSLVEHVAEVIRWAYQAGWTVIGMSGRDGVCRPQTEDWLLRHGVIYDYLFMRTEGDSRKDSLVKRELFDAHVRNQFNVQFVLDDRNQVVDMWRSLGLSCFQVAPGDF